MIEGYDFLRAARNARLSLLTIFHSPGDFLP